MMKIYAVCLECDDFYYGYLAPKRVFKDKEKAQQYARELYDDGWNATVMEYEVE